MRRTLWLAAAVLAWLGGAVGHAAAWEYLAGRELGYAIFTTHDSVRTSITPTGFASSAPPFWVVGSELRDARFPSAQFPAYFFPQVFEVTTSLCVPPFSIAQKCPSQFPRIFTARTPATVFSFSSDSPSHSFSQDTTTLPVSCSQELNTFLYQESVIPPDVQLATFQGLAGLHGLTARFVHEVRSVSQAPTCPAPFALAATLVGIKLWNPLSQTILNYQLTVFDSRGMAFNGDFWSFPAVNGDTVYGVSDSVDEVYGLATVETGRLGRFFSVGVLTRVQALLAANPLGLDPDPSHWTVKGFYSGTTTNGQAAITSTQESFGLAGF